MMSYAGKIEDLIAERDALIAALRRIAALDSSVDSPEGFNEWGEADCFAKAQEMARIALVLHNVAIEPGAL